MTKAAFNKKRALFTSTLGLKLRMKLAKCYIWSIALYGAELGRFGQKHLESIYSSTNNRNIFLYKQQQYIPVVCTP